MNDKQIIKKWYNGRHPLSFDEAGAMKLIQTARQDEREIISDELKQISDYAYRVIRCKEKAFADVACVRIIEIIKKLSGGESSKRNRENTKGKPISVHMAVEEPKPERRCYARGRTVKPHKNFWTKKGKPG